VLAALPTLSDAVIVSGCVPMSLTIGVQENPPFPLMLLFDTDDVPKASDITYMYGEKPDGTIVNVVFVRAGTAPAGESD